jgi:threonine dehydrogenase-like Zn-dependent dehydrogenase
MQSQTKFASSETMRSATLVAPGEFQIVEVPVPQPGPNEVRVRLEGCGVCGSNLAPFEGRPWFEYPRTAGEPGHEGWGEIDTVGSDVKDFRCGERVSILSNKAFAEFDVADQNAIVRLPPSFEKKPFPGEALGCAMNVFRRCDVEPGQTIAIVGIGFMGALLTALIANTGANVIAITRRPFALEVARSLGARHTIAMDGHWEVIQQVKDLTGGAGCERVIEAVGAQRPLDLAAELTRERGKLIIAGYHQDGPRQVNMQLWNWRGIDVINAHERDPRIYQRGMQAAVDAVASGRLDPLPLYTHTFPLEKIGDAFKTMAARPDGFMKAIIKL